MSNGGCLAWFAVAAAVTLFWEREPDWVLFVGLCAGSLAVALMRAADTRDLRRRRRGRDD